MLDLITTPAGEVDLSKYVLPTYVIWTRELDTWYIWSVVTISSYLSYFNYEHSWTQLQKSPILFNALESPLWFSIFYCRNDILYLVICNYYYHRYLRIVKYKTAYYSFYLPVSSLPWSMPRPTIPWSELLCVELHADQFVKIYRTSARSHCAMWEKFWKFSCIFAWNFQMSEVFFESIF